MDFLEFTCINIFSGYYHGVSIKGNAIAVDFSFMCIFMVFRMFVLVFVIASLFVIRNKKANSYS